MEHTYELIGMHCQSCVGKLRAALEAVPGVTSADVGLNPPRVRVVMMHHVPSIELDQAVGAAGDYRLRDMDDAADANMSDQSQARESLYPLVLIVGYIAGTVGVIALASGDRSLHTPMRHFMAGFFLVFSFFKLLDLRGFANAYHSYDVIAQNWQPWGNLYPFAELGLGVADLLNVNPMATNVLTLGLMLSASVGVLKTLLNRRAIRCACLGTVLNLPMTNITLAEDLGMAAMAGLMLTML